MLRGTHLREKTESGSRKYRAYFGKTKEEVVDKMAILRDNDGKYDCSLTFCEVFAEWFQIIQHVCLRESRTFLILQRSGRLDMFGEEAREVGSFQELTESEMEVLNQKISLIADALENEHHPVLKFMYFIADIAKVGGSYVTMTERVRKIDTVTRKIQLFKNIGASKSYMELETDKIRDISGDLIE